MINKLQEPPKLWLNQDLCEKLYKGIRENHLLEFDEPLPEFSTRFPGRLESILGSVEQSFDDNYLNPTVLHSAVAYFYQFAEGHAFSNGNKRVSVLFTHSFLMLNGMNFVVPHEDLYRTAVETVELSKTLSSSFIKEGLMKYFSQIIKELPPKIIERLSIASGM